jgi:hypothetical protein
MPSTRRRPMRKMGAYSKAIVLAMPDGRSAEAHLLQDTCESLTNHLGGKDRISATQRMLIERCGMLRLRCAKLDEKLLHGSWTEKDSREYIALSNSLGRTLRHLGLEGVDATKPSGRTMADLRREAALGEPAARNRRRVQFADDEVSA